MKIEKAFFKCNAIGKIENIPLKTKTIWLEIGIKVSDKWKKVEKLGFTNR